MLQIHCSGTPREIGLKHGQQAKEAIHRTIAFYTQMFADSAKLSWNDVRKLALEFEPVIREKWPAYLDEITAIASGAEVEIADIIAINVRTEIAFGLFSDGCTALSWKTGEGGGSWLAQNWDWNEKQKENIIQLTIQQAGKPTIKMMTEAGLIGKIGLNSSGVGVCLNAIRAAGLDKSKIPCHLGLRLVLESTSRNQAIERLEKYGVASACHMLIADGKEGGMGLEWSSKGVRKLPQNTAGQVFHSNHYLLDHGSEIIDTVWLDDSKFRVRRIEELCGKIEEGNVGFESLRRVFEDEEGKPGSICRSQEGESKSATLFNICMDLEGRRARVVMGRPTEKGEEVWLEF